MTPIRMLGRVLWRSVLGPTTFINRPRNALIFFSKRYAGSIKCCAGINLPSLSYFCGKQANAKCYFLRFTHGETEAPVVVFLSFSQSSK